VLYLRLIILVVTRGDVPVDSEVFLVTDFMNLKIKLVQSFECVHRSRVCVNRNKCSYIYKYLRRF
jgi:hypothetical protein